ncbi:hypothetical protein O0235_08690 [Tepidiforma flava]|uniref:EfeO-type cupredoxin-like domain-containing protein n=1 Tax=Tepidiforma flava TaxID=3004094 RepID=A0ABY7M4A5_9CHLR|nr:hypothetical protein [Tepidiforma flava]WBL34870.1 hypothetical protein O0235_08690 [Tepidiforma flava]
MRRLLFAGAAAVLGVAAAACGGSNPVTVTGGHGPGDGHMSAMAAPPEGAIRVGLRNWSVDPAVTSARAGKVVFWAVHEMDHAHGHDEGGQVHDLQVLKKTGDGSWELAGQVRNLGMGEAALLELNLEPGEYELACTVVEETTSGVVSHYAKGMRTPFTVTGS